MKSLTGFCSEVTLVGGSGRHEGNILVGGMPVCDDGHNAQNAKVVCRFAKNTRKCLTLAFCCKITREISPGCLGTLSGNPFSSLSLVLSIPPSKWTMSSALATRHPSLTAPMPLVMIVVLMREQESNAQMVYHT